MLNIGPVMLDIESVQLSLEDIELISLEQVGGVILFKRNFKSASQLLELTQSIKNISPHIVIAVDQEGGRVQRFTEDFSKLPPLNTLGKYYKKNKIEAIAYASDLAELMALEIQSVGCDLSFSPVLDLGGELSKVIGDRAFSNDIDEINILAQAYIAGMNKGGMVATGKHFPGHGSVEFDSHYDIGFDDRDFETIKNNDLKVFSQLINQVSAIMPAHVIYPQVDSQPAGFSVKWLQSILREELGFQGVIFSDDLSMKAAEVVGSFSDRANLALNAGCDMVLVCNNRAAAWKVVESILPNVFSKKIEIERANRLFQLISQPEPISLSRLKQTDRWQYLNERLTAFIKE